MSDYERGHAVKVCRERCADAGYWGEGFEECVKACVEELRARS